MQWYLYHIAIEIYRKYIHNLFLFKVDFSQKCSYLLFHSLNLPQINFVSQWTLHAKMKVNQITEKQQKIVRPIRWSRGEYEKPNVKQSNNKGNRGENRENEVTKTRVTTAEKEEITIIWETIVLEPAKIAI